MLINYKYCNIDRHIQIENIKLNFTETIKRQASHGLSHTAI